LLGLGWTFALATAAASPPLDAPPDTVSDDSVVDQNAPAKPTKRHKHHEKTQADAAPAEPLPAASPLTLEGRFGRLQPTGRVFVRASLERHHEAVIDDVGATHVEPVDSFDLSIPSARVGLYYHAPVKWLTADVEVELTHKPELKDAWLRGRFRHATVQAGQFKMPFSVIEMESIWKLPLASRGLLHTALVKELQVAGRRPGFALELRGRGKVRPSLTLGGFQGSVLVDDDPDKRDVDLLSRQSLSSQSWVARAELKAYDFVFGAEYEDRLGTPELLVTKYYQTGGADMTLDTELGRTGLRIWVEGIVGQSWLENRYKPPDGRDAVFVAGRLITALRFLARKKGDFYIEPYGMLGVLDPDTEVSADFAVEEVLGVNVGLWRLVRLGLEGQVDRLQRNFPQTYYFGDDPDRTALMLQAGAEF
jgi:hypothetical protein